MTANDWQMDLSGDMHPNGLARTVNGGNNAALPVRLSLLVLRHFPGVIDAACRAVAQGLARLPANHGEASIALIDDRQPASRLADTGSSLREYNVHTSVGSILCLLAALMISTQVPAEDWQQMREEMIREIEIDAYETRKYLGKQTLDARVIAALAKVPRHEFVPPPYQGSAYLNQPLPIGGGQTISQPFIVALMTDLLDVDKSSKVYELGTGSGYQAAVLAELVDSVYSVEIVASLAEEAAERLDRLGYTNVHTRTGDGFYGWPEEAPFDAIIVTAAGLEVPRTLLEQLKPGGNMVIPVGERLSVQQLLVVSKGADGKITERTVLPVRFVPITGDH